MRGRTWGVIAVLVLSAFSVPAAAHEVFTVNTTADSDDTCDQPPAGDCSLREAINASNAQVPDGDNLPNEIAFDFGAGVTPPFTIQLLSPLPEITFPVDIDSRSEPRYPRLPPFMPVLIIDGGGTATIFRVRTRTSIVGFAMTNASVSAVDVEGADFALVQACYFGVHPVTGDSFTPGPAPAFGSYAIDVRDSDTVLIGGTSEVAPNVIAGGGLGASRATNVGTLFFENNLVGIDPSGSSARPNGALSTDGYAVEIDDVDMLLFAGNTVSGNFDGGVWMTGVPLAVVEQNRIGTDASGGAALANAGTGLALSGALGGAAIQNNVIRWNAGDGMQVTADATGDWEIVDNTIRDNDGAGIAVLGLAARIQSNAIANNGALGIDVADAGVTANDSGDLTLPTNFPEMTLAIRAGANVLVRGCSVPGATIEFFRAEPDPSNHGEGVESVGFLVEGATGDTDSNTGCSSGNDAAFRYSFDVPADVDSITATATVNDSTSEFSTVIHVDSDADGVSNNIDVDDDNDGIPDLIDGAEDPDSDGIPNRLDLDSDNDGIPDSIEAGAGTLDADHDGQLDDGVPGAVQDANGDGLMDSVDVGDGLSALEVLDSDGSGGADFADVDADGDGIYDIDEVDADANGTLDVLEATDVDADDDGQIDLFVDSDADGLADDVDPRSNGGGPGPGEPFALVDSDGDTTFDYQDGDDDGDTILTRFESPDPNGDRDLSDAQNSDMVAPPDYLDSDDDNDSIATRYEMPDPDADGDPSDARNTDGTDAPDYLDTDDDNDGFPTNSESPDPNGDGDPTDAANTNNADVPDLPDYLDPEAPTGSFDADGDGFCVPSGVDLNFDGDCEDTNEATEDADCNDQQSTAFPQPTEALCDDTLDNDCDGSIDGNDLDCECEGDGCGSGNGAGSGCALGGLAARREMGPGAIWALLLLLVAARRGRSRVGS